MTLQKTSEKNHYLVILRAPSQCATEAKLEKKEKNNTTLTCFSLSCWKYFHSAWWFISNVLCTCVAALPLKESF